MSVRGEPRGVAIHFKEHFANRRQVRRPRSNALGGGQKADSGEIRSRSGHFCLKPGDCGCLQCPITSEPRGRGLVRTWLFGAKDGVRRIRDHHRRVPVPVGNRIDRFQGHGNRRDEANHADCCESGRCGCCCMHHLWLRGCFSGCRFKIEGNRFDVSCRAAFYTFPDTSQIFLRFAQYSTTLYAAQALL